MTMQYDVKSAHTNTSAVLVSSRCRLKQITFNSNGTAGTIILYDNASAASGIILWQFDFGANVVSVPVLIPGEGILAYNGIYASLTNANSCTICYG
jgi:hypothetical protein